MAATRNKDTGLTDKEEAFCQFVVDHVEASDSDAYRAAYSTKNMKSSTVNTKAYGLKQRGHVRARIDQLRKERSERTKIDSDYVLKRLAEFDQLDVLDIVDDSGAVKPLSQWPKVWRTSISAIDVQEISTGGDVAAVIKKIKLPEKVRNLELIGKHVGVQAWNEKVTHEAGKSLKELLAAAKE